jgi:toluene monooxygenase system protein D
MGNDSELRSVGPVMKKGDMGDAVVEAIYENNSGRKIVIEEHASYFRIQVQGECLLKLDTVREMYGSDIIFSDIEACMPSFEGFIRVETDQVRFLAESN